VKTEPLPGSLVTVTSHASELASDGKPERGVAEVLRGRLVGLAKLLHQLRLLLPSSCR
jgi:hypothetical protein